MKVAIVNMRVRQGKCEENFAWMKQTIEEAKAQKADLIVFPQNAVSGYLLGDLWLDDAWCRYVDSFNEKLIALSEDIAIVWGNIRYRNHRRFNAAFFAWQKQTHMRVKKHTQAPYAQDARYFEENPINAAIEFKDKILALNFGKDLQLADININLDNAVYDMDDTNKLSGNMIYVNAVGVQNQGKNVMILQGGSGVRMNKKTIAQLPYFTEGMQVVDLDAQTEAAPVKTDVLTALCYGIKTFDEEVFQGKVPWIVGMSGGLDSSVTAALLCAALGSKRVRGYNLATQHNSETTRNNARQEAQALGIAYEEGYMEPLVDATRDMLDQEFGFQKGKLPTLVMENIQARSRGFLLSAFAGALGGVVVNNGNKVETALGYCTLYGDSIGALSIIGDLTKVALFDLSHQLNAYFQKEVVPENLLPKVKGDTIDWTMPPSAELKDGQFDPMKWFYHDYLIEHLGKDFSVCDYLKSYLSGSVWESEIAPWLKYYGLDDANAFVKDMEWLLTTMKKNAFKRLQLPPLLSLHPKTLASQLDAQMQAEEPYLQELLESIRKR